MNAGLSHGELVAHLKYEPATGQFTRLFKAHCRFAQGSVSGSRTRTGYVRVTINALQYAAHRLAWFYMVGEWPKGEVDHINGDRADNRWPNLRVVTKSENQQNRCTTIGKTGLLGVNFHRGTGRFQARIVVSGRRKFLGLFTTPEAAHAAYREAKAQYHPASRRLA